MGEEIEEAERETLLDRIAALEAKIEKAEKALSDADEWEISSLLQCNRFALDALRREP